MTSFTPRLLGLLSILSLLLFICPLECIPTEMPAQAQSSQSCHQQDPASGEEPLPGCQDCLTLSTLGVQKTQVPVGEVEQMSSVAVEHVYGQTPGFGVFQTVRPPGPSGRNILRI